MKNAFSQPVLRSALFVSALLALPALAQAHPGHQETSGIAHGFLHPLGGFDHLCAMIAVGLWAAQMGGRALWAVPATFVGVMALGGALGMMGVNIPFVEQGIVLSVLILGVLIVAAARLPLSVSMVLVGLFAVFHGFAHGAEMPASASGLAYAFGFILATTLLHGLGILVGIGIQRLAQPQLVRVLGAAIMVCAAYIWIG